MGKIKINSNAQANIEHFGWNISAFETVPEIQNADNVVVTDADLFRMFLTIDGETAEVDCDGVVEFHNGVYKDGKLCNL